MADESSVAAGKRFSRDMRLIREDRGISIDALHKETRISRTLIESFEEGGLYDHSTFNEVYLRSFVRAYAEVIDISPDEAVEGLEGALEGNYEEALAEQYLGSGSIGEDERSTEKTDAPHSGAEEEGDEPRSAAPAAGGPEGRGGIVGAPRALDGDSDEETETEETQDDEPEPEEASAPEDEPGAEEEPDAEEDADAGVELDREEDADESSSQAPLEGGSEKETGSSQEVVDRGSEAPAGSEEPTEEPDPRSDAETRSVSEEDAAKQEESEERDAAASTDVEEDVPSWMEGDDESERAPSPEGETVSPEPTPPGEGRVPPPDGGSGETGVVGEPTALGSEEAPTEAARSGASAVPEPRAHRRSGWGQFFRGEKREMVWGGIGILVVLLVLAGIGIAYFSGGSASTQERSATATPDTAASSAPTDTAATPSKPPPAPISLGETVNLTVLATSPVTGIRIQRDDDLERPYWIEEGEAETFPFQERVVLDNELGDIRLFVAGYPYLGGRPDTTGRLVITRSEVEAFADTLRGAPATLSVTPDTIPKGPPPEQ